MSGLVELLRGVDERILGELPAPQARVLRVVQAARGAR
jgi:hypothetical protein